MKKILILFTVLFTFCLSAFAEYKPIPKELSKQYKTEIENIINQDYPIVINKIDNYQKQALSYYNDIMRNGYDIGKHVSLVNMAELVIPAADIDLYAKLMRITQEKYLGIKYLPLGTDSVVPMEDFLTPYFKDNNVNSKKLQCIIKYEKKKIKILEKYLKKVQQIVPDNY